MLRLVGLALLVILVATAATGGSLAVAIAIAGVAAVVIPFVLKLVPAVGKYMIAICVGTSLVIAVAAELFSGEIVLSNLQATDVTTLLAIFLSVEGLSQRLYSILIQSPKTAPAVA
jgi:hypothetical protein